jgi:hypothetical protein
MPRSFNWASPLKSVDIPFHCLSSFHEYWILVSLCVNSAYSKYLQVQNLNYFFFNHQQPIPQTCVLVFVRYDQVEKLLSGLPVLVGETLRE